MASETPGSIDETVKEVNFSRETEYFADNAERLLKEYGPGHYFALQGTEILDHDPSQPKLAERISQKYPGVNILMACPEDYYKKKLKQILLKLLRSNIFLITIVFI